MGSITFENWNHCGLKTLKLRAFIGMGAVPGSSSPGLIYCVTLSDPDFKEIDQTDFGTLEQALTFINDRYGEWDFYDLRKSEGGGCGSCSAH